jgi:protein-tyrosine kinase
MNTTRDPLTLPESDTAPQERVGRHLIGAILIEEGKLSAVDAERVYDYQKKKHLRFGDAAVRLKLVKTSDVQLALSKQFDYSHLPAREATLSRELVTAFEPFSPAAESFRLMRAQLSLRWMKQQGAARTLAIISPTPADGRTFVAANLAVVLSQLGERTLLVDADLRRGRQHGLFGLENGAGLSTILSGRIVGHEIQRIASLPGLSVLPAGPMPPNPQELLNRPAFTALLDEVSHGFDVVLADTSASEYGADAQIVAARVEASLLVVRKNATRLPALFDLTDHLKQMHAVVAGTFMND